LSQINTNVDGITLKLTNLEKVLWPADNITKAELIQYYISVSEYMLPLVTERPLSLIRYPDGIDGPKFYSKNAPDFTPEWINLFLKDDINYICLNKKADLVYLANLASLEIHAMNIQMQTPANPDTIIFDLDPSEGLSFETIKTTAIDLYNMLEDKGYHPHIKTSGSKGLHIYIPILPLYSRIEVFDTAKKLGQEFINYNGQCTLKLSKEKRQGKILIDIYRNHDSQTCICPLSTRAKPGAPVSMPLHFDDVKDIHSSAQFDIRNAAEYLIQQKPWKDFKNLSTEIHHLPKDEAPVQVVVKSSTNKGNFDKTSEPKPKPTFVMPNVDTFDFMLADQALSIPKGSDYIYEIKWDGIRAKAIKTNEKVAIYSRSGRDISVQFPEICEKLNAIDGECFVLDGELVSLDEKGIPIFGNIISRMHSKSTTVSQFNVSFYVFDILYLDGSDCRPSPLHKRKEWLHAIVKPNNKIRISETFDDGEALFEAAKANNMEGIMAKNIHSTYQSARSANWQKIKVRTIIDAIIVGYTKGKGDRSPLFGALHIASIDGKNYLGKVGTGFDETKMKEIFAIIKDKPIKAKPFAASVEDAQNTVWIDCDQQCEVQYASITTNGTLREPVFLRIKYTDE
jgi:DNA ligase D-like protein (predicted ligase)/DNA ligase D-like protein (predicted polymerase)